MYTIINYSALVISMLLIFYVCFLGILRFFKYDTLADRLSTKEDGILFIRWVTFLLSIVFMVIDFSDGIPQDKLSNISALYIFTSALCAITFIGACVIMFFAELRRKMPQR